MWRFIIVTFGFLGLAFYQLSGGADYAPREGSRQHATQTQAAPVPQVTAPAVIGKRTTHQHTTQETHKSATAPDARVVLASTQPTDVDADKRVRLTLNAQPGARTAGVDTVSADPDKIAQLVAAASIDARAPAPPATKTAEGHELRKVKSDRVNMRSGPGKEFDVVDQLTRGAEVAILYDSGDGWVELRVLGSGQEGWMADFLLVAAN